MGERAYRVKTRPPDPAAAGVVRLRSRNRGTRWVVRIVAEGNIKARMTVVGGPQTDLAFVADSDVEALMRAEAWLRERYDIVEDAETLE